MHTQLMHYTRVAAVSAALAMVAPVHAGPIPFNTFLEFSFTDAGVPATGCDPADPAGPFCIPSSGTPTQFLDAPPWTFLAPAGGALLTVVDAFLAGDRFEIFDFGVSLGRTSPPVGNGECGDDPLVCLADPNVSHGLFALLGGPHSISLTPTISDGGGGGYLQVAQAVPAPSPLALLLGGLIGLYGLRKVAGKA